MAGEGIPDDLTGEDMDLIEAIVEALRGKAEAKENVACWRKKRRRRKLATKNTKNTKRGETTTSHRLRRFHRLNATTDDDGNHKELKG